ncbi:hypothetical protein AAFF_G00212330 [Aldrovandia affinis]|uniref:Uncharacterized protein n=1 Tax=Aldrovandia affinis TaxID=143900 RepID=A0AAD7RGY3_9TELE|nr:hypothetical protein AAFF_G00212330 [Aldrovandia affinis]
MYDCRFTLRYTDMRPAQWQRAGRPAAIVTAPLWVETCGQTQQVSAALRDAGGLNDGVRSPRTPVEQREGQ